jgi:hypothetical protein
MQVEWLSKASARRRFELSEWFLLAQFLGADDIEPLERCRSSCYIRILLSHHVSIVPCRTATHLARRQCWAPASGLAILDLLGFGPPHWRPSLATTSYFRLGEFVSTTKPLHQRSLPIMKPQSQYPREPTLSPVRRGT